MKTMNRRHALGLLGAATLGGCAPALVTTPLGEDPFEGGIGGTGIVGLMTASGSVLINGLRVEVPSSTKVYAGGQLTGDGILRPGKALTIVARARLDRLEALRIDVDDPLTGILARKSSGLSINATPVRPEPGVSTSALIGKHVSASGLWQPDGSLRTSLLRLAPVAEDSIAGVVIGSSATGWRIGQTQLVRAGGLSLQSGQYATAVGRFNNDRFSVKSVRQGRFRTDGVALRQLSVEGYLEPVATAPGFRISGLGHSFDRRLELDPFRTFRTVFFGPYTGRFVARRAVLVPESVEQRRQLLAPEAGKTFARALNGAAARRIEDR